jgi:excinuclease ABC subunit C
MADERFGSRPDLIVLDGGRPQLNAALAMFEQMGVDIPIVGLAKRDEEVFVPWDTEGPVVLPGGSASLYLIKQVRDEAHRFAITFHRELRGKGMTASILDTVPGIGPVRKKALLKHFKSMRALREATLEQIQDAHVLPSEVAADLYAVLAQYNDNNQNKSQDEATIYNPDNFSKVEKTNQFGKGKGADGDALADNQPNTMSGEERKDVAGVGLPSINDEDIAADGDTL